MSSSDYIPLDSLNLLVERHNLGSVTTVLRLSSDPTSGAFKLVTDTGAWFVKQHRIEQSIERLQSEQAIMSQLRQTGFTLLPEPWLLVKEALATQLNDRLWSVSKFTESDPPFLWTDSGWSATHCLQSGAALAQLHSCGRVVLGNSQDLDRFLGTSVLPDVAAWLNDAYDTFSRSKHAHSSAALPLLTGSIESLKQHLDILLPEISRLQIQSELLPTIVHGDFHPGNTLFKNNDLQVVIDWDFARIEHPLYDLGYAAVMFCGQRSNSDASLNQDFLQALLSGYLGSYPNTTGADLADNPEFHSLLSKYMQLACYLLLAWALGGYSQTTADHQVCDRVIVRALHLLQTLQANSH